MIISKPLYITSWLNPSYKLQFAYNYILTELIDFSTWLLCLMNNIS